MTQKPLIAILLIGIVLLSGCTETNYFFECSESKKDMIRERCGCVEKCNGTLWIPEENCSYILDGSEGCGIYGKYTMEGTDDMNVTTTITKDVYDVDDEDIESNVNPEDLVANEIIMNSPYELFNCTDSYVCNDGFKFESSFIDNTTRGFGICDTGGWHMMFENKIYYMATNETVRICMSECSCKRVPKK